jgi:hypothetical protein
MKKHDVLILDAHNNQRAYIKDDKNSNMYSKGDHAVFAS